jgi:acetylglutamate kinase
MIPKLENAFDALKAGVSKVVITKASELGKESGTSVLA